MCSLDCAVADRGNGRSVKQMAQNAGTPSIPPTLYTLLSERTGSLDERL